jgi:hypothetical protein
MGETAGTIVIQGATAEISRLPGAVAIDFVVVADAIAGVKISGRDVAEAHGFVGVDRVFSLGNLCVGIDRVFSLGNLCLSLRNLCNHTVTSRDSRIHTRSSDLLSRLEQRGGLWFKRFEFACQMENRAAQNQPTLWVERHLLSLLSENERIFELEGRNFTQAEGIALKKLLRIF